jgi:hypothetical protein
MLSHARNTKHEMTKRIMTSKIDHLQLALNDAGTHVMECENLEKGIYHVGKGFEKKWVDMNPKQRK